MSADKPRLPRRVTRAPQPAPGAPGVTPLTAPDPATTEWVPLWNPSAGLQVTGGDAAHDAVDTGDPVKIGAKATASISGLTPVTAGDRTNLFAGLDGVLLLRPHCNLEDIVDGYAISSDALSHTVIAAPGAGLRLYITSVILSNSSAVDTEALLQSAGTTRLPTPAPPKSGAILNFTVPFKCGVNEAFTFTATIAASFVTVSAIGFKSKLG